MTRIKKDPNTIFLGRKHTEESKQKIRETLQKKWRRMQDLLEQEENRTKSPVTESTPVYSIEGQESSSSHEG